MKPISILSFALSAPMAMAGGLQFTVQHDEAARRGLLRANDLYGYWGSFHQFGFCVEKIVDPSDPTCDKVSDDLCDKVKMMPCDSKNPAQMWKFDKQEFDRDIGPYYSYGGLLYNMEGGCMAIVGPVRDGKNVRVAECDRNNAKQHWLSDGDSTIPRDSRDFTMSPNQYPLKNGARVVLVEDWAYSLDY